MIAFKLASYPLAPKDHLAPSKPHESIARISPPSRARYELNHWRLQRTTSLWVLTPAESATFNGLLISCVGLWFSDFKSGQLWHVYSRIMAKIIP